MLPLIWLNGMCVKFFMFSAVYHPPRNIDMVLACLQKRPLVIQFSDNSRLAPSKWDTSLQSNTVSHWLDANLGISPAIYSFMCILQVDYTVPGYRSPPPVSEVRFPEIYRKTSNIRLTLVGNKIVDHSDVVGASPVGAAPTTSSFST